MSYRKLLPTLFLLTLVVGCQSSPFASDPQNALPAARNAPPSCAPGFAQRAGRLSLENTRTPKDLNDSKNEPLRFANTINVSKPVNSLGRATNFDDGWSSLALSITSEGAQSISVHLSGLALPRGSEIWLCSPDGLHSEGPYRDGTGGDIWTPVVPGSEAWLEILVPTQHLEELKATLAEVFGGFR